MKVKARVSVVTEKKVFAPGEVLNLPNAEAADFIERGFVEQLLAPAVVVEFTEAEK